MVSVRAVARRRPVRSLRRERRSFQPVAPTEQGLTKDKRAALTPLTSVIAGLIRDRCKRDDPEQGKNGERSPNPSDLCPTRSADTSSAGISTISVPHARAQPGGRGSKTSAAAPCSSQFKPGAGSGPPLSRRFRGGDDTLLMPLGSFQVGHSGLRVSAWLRSTPVSLRLRPSRTRSGGAAVR